MLTSRPKRYRNKSSNSVIVTQAVQLQMSTSKRAVFHPLCTGKRDTMSRRLASATGAHSSACVAPWSAFRKLMACFHRSMIHVRLWLAITRNDGFRLLIAIRLGRRPAVEGRQVWRPLWVVDAIRARVIVRKPRQLRGLQPVEFGKQNRPPWQTLGNAGQAMYLS